MSTYFIADPHFNDKNIWQYERSNIFKSVEEMNQTMIKNWVNQVDEQGIVYVLGDFGDPSFVKRLTGKIILIKGNHDVLDNTCYIKQGFSAVYDYPIIYEQFYILSHEPMYVNTNMPYVNVFGHIHGNPNYKDKSSHGYCVSAERINYTPIFFCDIISWFKEANND